MQSNNATASSDGVEPLWPVFASSSFPESPSAGSMVLVEKLSSSSFPDFFSLTLTASMIKKETSRKARYLRRFIRLKRKAPRCGHSRSSSACNVVVASRLNRVGKLVLG